MSVKEVTTTKSQPRKNVTCNALTKLLFLLLQLRGGKRVQPPRKVRLRITRDVSSSYVGGR